MDIIYIIINMFITVFDWDDTLMATSHFQTNEDENIDTTRLSTNIRRLVSIAKTLGQVYIITNAEIGWVHQCINELLIDCEIILDQAHLFSTVDTRISSNLELEFWKSVAFNRVQALFTKRSRNNHLLCFGDCENDRLATLRVRDRIGDYVHVKNVKFLEQPSLDLLIEQQNCCILMMNMIASHNGHLDYFLSGTLPKTTLVSIDRIDHVDPEVAIVLNSIILQLDVVVVDVSNGENSWDCGISETPSLDIETDLS